MLLSLERMILLAYTKEDLIKDLDRLGISQMSEFSQVYTYIIYQ